MNNEQIYEDKRLPPYRVFLGYNVQQEIKYLISCNKNNVEGIRRLKEYVKSLKRYISNPTLAWDNEGRYTHYQNGAIHVMEIGYNFLYILKTNQTGKSYVCIIRIWFDTNALGLKDPRKMNENREFKRVYYIKESQLRLIIRETLRRVLLTA